jgi:soluble lytic murein transglycosylase
VQSLALAWIAASIACTPVERDTDPVDRDPRTEAMADPAYREASAALDERRPWRAEALIAPALADSARRTPWVLILAAEAAAASDRWTLVDSLLGGTTFDDSRAAAPAGLLLARSALEQSDETRALAHARDVLALHAGRRQSAEAFVFLARAHERLGARDSARVAYSAAAETLTPAHDWLTLRAAALTSDSAERAEMYEGLQTPTARRHADYVEAQLLERTGRARAAIALYERAGEPVHAMRLRAATASGTAARERSRRELVAFVATHTGTPAARVAVEMLDDGRFKLTATEEVIVARSAAEHGPLSRARTGLERAFKQRAPTAEERLFQISILAESGPASRRQAEAILAKIKKPSPMAGIAGLERGKLLLRRGQKASARTVLRDVARLYPNDTAAAAGALFVLAEMATDEQRDAAARDAYLALARKYPSSDGAPRARFDAAILALAARNNAVASAELDSLVDLYPTSVEASAARYWSARARLAVRDTIGAQVRFQLLLESDSTSYYASQAARHLGTTAWTPTATPDTFASIPDVTAAVERADLLERLGMASEARLEMQGLAASADSSVERVLAIANEFRARAQMRRAMELGRRAIALGATDARAWRLVYPIGEADLVASEASGRKVDPALVAALIRQESSFEPHATSEAGARGLMQVMPRVAKALARAEKITPWDAAMLYDPEVNVRLGVIHLRSFTSHYSHPALALAAYNAGPGRVARWQKRPGARDPELFIERIRFTETRGYVRTVLRSRDMYAALYDWERLSGAN